MVNGKLGSEIYNWNHKQTFNLFCNDELTDFIIKMIKVYATETNELGWVPIDRSDIDCFLGILMLSDYVKLQSAMPQNKICLILKKICFCDNGDLGRADKCSKVALLMNIKQEWLKFFFSKIMKIVNVDESMIPCCGKFGQMMKQRMPLKPIRSGYKVW